MVVADREAFERQMKLVAAHIRNDHQRLQHYRSTWPIFTAELRSLHGDPYRGEVRPISHTGLGNAITVHVDAK